MSNQTQPIPAGFHTLTPHLIVRNASEALEFYARAFGAEIIEKHLGPDGTSVMHAEIKIGDSMLMLADEYPDKDCLSPLARGGTSVILGLYVENCDAAFERAVSAGATVLMPLADMFWGDRYGQVADPYGHQWSIATHVKDVTQEELAQAMAAFSSTSCS